MQGKNANAAKTAKAARNASVAAAVKDAKSTKAANTTRNANAGNNANAAGSANVAEAVKDAKSATAANTTRNANAGNNANAARNASVAKAVKDAKSATAANTTRNANAGNNANAARNANAAKSAKSTITAKSAYENDDTLEEDVARARLGEDVAILIPCYNEALTIAQVVDDFHAVMPKALIYVYDNNSSDDTAQIARDHGAIVRYEGLQGKGNVVRSMFRDIEARYYVMVDGDDTYPAEAAADLVEPLARGTADMTVGDRMSNGSYREENGRAFHGFGNRLVCWLIKVLYGYVFEDVMTGYRAFTRTFVKTMPILSTGFQVETEISIQAVDKRWRIKNIPIDYRDRPADSPSKLSTFGDGALVLVAIASLFREYRPMAFFGSVAAVLVILGLTVGIPVIAEFAQTGLVDRLPSAVLAVALVICGALSMTAGLVLETVAKSNKKQWELAVYRVREQETAKQDIHEEPEVHRGWGASAPEPQREFEVYRVRDRDSAEQDFQGEFEAHHGHEQGKAVQGSQRINFR